MKIKNYDTKTDNHYKANKCYSDNHKTFKTQDLQIVKVPKELNLF